MIRFHAMDYERRPLMLRVSARRKPRGFVKQSQEVVETRSVSWYEASVTHTLVHGWRPISMIGREGPFCSTLERAVEILMTFQKFQEDVAHG